MGVSQILLGVTYNRTNLIYPPSGEVKADSESDYGSIDVVKGGCIPSPHGCYIHRNKLNIPAKKSMKRSK